MELQKKRRRLEAFARTLAPDPTDLESVDAKESSLRAWAEAVPEQERERALSAVARLSRQEELAPDDVSVIEAIVLPQGRPVVDVVEGRYLTPEPPWTHLDDPTHRKILEPVLASIGRIEVPALPRPYAGTGFVVGRGLLMTNRHVAQLFTSGLGVRELRFTSGVDRVRVDFKREVSPAAGSLPFEVTSVAMIHPYWDMALLRVQGLGEAQRPLVLDPSAPEDLSRRDVVVIGYPARDRRSDLAVQDRIFRGVYRVKRLQPGQITGAGSTESFGHRVRALLHDSSTLGGNSGSAVVDASSGKVLGLHFAGKYLVTNYAVSAYDLACDPRVVAGGVEFATRPTRTGPAVWEAYWQAGGAAASPPRPRPRPQPRPSLFVAPAPPAIRVEGPPRPPAGGAPVATFTIPLEITVRLGAPATSPAGHPGAPAPAALLQDSIDREDALARAQEAESRPYYDAAKDAADRAAYYADLGGAAPSFEALHDLLERTHAEQPSYKPTRWVYPWVDRQPDLSIRSLYSSEGTSYSVEELVDADLAVEHAREERIAESIARGGGAEEAEEDAEAALPYNCEHTVPQSWFDKREPMRGDLHHLFACESRCNSFRGNRPYRDFAVESVMDDCGRSEDGDFEPAAGKGAVARATLYFLVRYPGEIGGEGELPPARLPTLLRWHRENPPGEWEQHRNQAIFELQGNRNPFIDHPEWAEGLDLSRGFESSGENLQSTRHRATRRAPLPWVACSLPELREALAALDRARVEELCTALLARARGEGPRLPEKDAVQALRLLRRKRMFALMEQVAQGLALAGYADAEIQRQHAQALIDQGRLDDAEGLLRGMLASSTLLPAERAEALGLLGRVHKDRAVAPSTPEPRRGQELLEAIRVYHETYADDPPSRAWHGINTVALAKRAARHGIALPAPIDAAALACEILARIEGLAPASRTPFDLATAAEACLALELGDQADGWLGPYLSHRDTDAFELASFLRQLREVWEIDEAHAFGAVLVAVQAALLAASGGAVAYGETRLCATEQAAALPANGAHLEKIFGAEAPQTVSWFRRGLARARAVARVGDEWRTAGTGFLVRAGDFFPPRADLPAEELLLMTNAHVLGTTYAYAIRPSRARISFDELGVKGARVREILWESPVTALDACVARLDPAVAGEAVPLAGAAEPTWPSAPPRRLFVVGHPAAGELCLSMNDNLQVGWLRPKLHYRTPTAPGSSGSPVFDEDWNLLGLHRAGNERMRRPDGTGTYEANEGVWIHAIRAETARITRPGAPPATPPSAGATTAPIAAVPRRNGATREDR